MGHNITDHARIYIKLSFHHFKSQKCLENCNIGNYFIVALQFSRISILMIYLRYRSQFVSSNSLICTKLQYRRNYPISITILQIVQENFYPLELLKLSFRNFKSQKCLQNCNIGNYLIVALRAKFSITWEAALSIQPIYSRYHLKCYFVRSNSKIYTKLQYRYFVLVWKMQEFCFGF